jgi:hypothetical protein
MKILPISVNQDCNPPMPESVRKACELAANAAWVSAHKLAHENAQATWREKIAVSEKKLLDVTTVCAAQAAEILDLRAKLADNKAKAAAAASAAQQEAAKASRQFAVMTEEAARAVSRAENVAIHVEKLKITLQAAQITAQTLAEIHSATQAQDAPRDRVEIPETEDQTVVDPISAARQVGAERGERLQRDEADLIAAATVFIKAVCRFRSR